MEKCYVIENIKYRNIENVRHEFKVIIFEDIFLF